MDESNFMRALAAVINRKRDISVHFHINSECIKCSAIEREMFRVGAVIFCKKCCVQEFKTTDPVSLEKERYKFWLKKWYDKAV